ncbi:MAG TPA: hypothetical protein VF753_13625 [Terriglobales bacterium]
MKTAAFVLVVLAFTSLGSFQAFAQYDTRTHLDPAAPLNFPIDSSHQTQNEFAVAKAELNRPAEKTPVAPAESALTEKLRHDADELAYLAQSIPTDVDKTTKGLLPKDLAVKLKKIEELSKSLRTKISR